MKKSRFQNGLVQNGLVSKIGLVRLLFASALCGAGLVAPTLATGQELGPITAPEFDAAKAELGKRLFFDKRLSGDVALSCATCHQPDKGFADGLPLSLAYPGSKGFRNTPTLINTALQENWFADGRIGTNLNDVTREMLTEDYLMNMDMRLMQERVKQDPVYIEMFEAAGYGEPSNGSIRKAIPEYLKTLVSRNAPFDTGQMSEAALRGQDLFTGQAGCVACHNGPLLSDDARYNTAVPENPEIWSDPLRHMTWTAFASFIGVENYMNVRRDVGAYIWDRKADGSTIGTFMTPTLRELKYTAPYMHNGMFGSLFEVVAFYNAGGGDDPNKSPLIKPLGLTFVEQKDLVAFLESLSGDPLTSSEFVWEAKIPTNYPAIENWREQEN